MLDEFDLKNYIANIFTSHDPLVVLVEEDGWTPVGPQTPRTLWLYTVLLQAGGPDCEALKPGYYHFNLMNRWFNWQFKIELIENL